MPNVMGVISNIINANKANDVNQRAIDQQKQVAELVKNPQLLAAKIASLRQPLSQSLTSSVGNDVQAQLAEKGLSSSPQIAGAVESQALAPFEQRSQEDATNAFFSLLGQGNSSTQTADATLPKSSDTSGFWGGFSGGEAPGVPGISDYAGGA